MFELQFANYLNILVWLHSGIKSFHRGYIEEIGVDQANNFDVDLDTGKVFPHLAMFPGEGTWQTTDGQNGTLNVDLRLFDLETTDNEGEIKNRSRGELWFDLKKDLYQILREVRLGKFDNTKAKTFGIPTGTIEWFEDVDVATNTLIYVGAKFTIEYGVTCDDFNFNYNNLPQGLVYPPTSFYDYEQFDPNDPPPG